MKLFYKNIESKLKITIKDYNITYLRNKKPKLYFDLKYKYVWPSPFLPFVSHWQTCHICYGRVMNNEHRLYGQIDLVNNRNSKMAGFLFSLSTWQSSILLIIILIYHIYYYKYNWLKLVNVLLDTSSLAPQVNHSCCYLLWEAYSQFFLAHKQISNS